MDEDILKSLSVSNTHHTLTEFDVLTVSVDAVDTLDGTRATPTPPATAELPAALTTATLPPTIQSHTTNIWHTGHTQ